MKILVLYNRAVILKKGTENDLVCEQEIDIILPLVVDLLRARGHEVSTLETTRKFWGIMSDIRSQFDIVFNLAEGFGNCNANEALVPAMLEALDVPFTGASSQNMIITMDKEKTSTVVSASGVPVPRSQLFREGNGFMVNSRLRFPLIVKPVREEASVGITNASVVATLSELSEQVKLVFKLYQQPALAEEFIDGREISVGVVGNGPDVHVFPPLEFVFDDHIPPQQRIRSYEYKWGGKKEQMRKANLPPNIVSRLEKYTRVAYSVMDCRDYARMDYRLTEAGEIFMLEVNYNPGIGPNTHGLNNTLTMMASFEGCSFGDLIERIILTAKKRYNQIG